MDQERCLKYIIVGDASVGKSSICSKFLFQTMQYHLNRYHVSCLKKNMTLDGENIMLELWDIKKMVKHDYLPPKYYRKSNGVLLVYDIINRQSFDSLRDVWYEEVCLYSGYEAQCILIGNKCDMECERAVEYSTGKEFADSLNIPFIETSAKENLNVEEAFVLLTAVIVRKLYETETRDEDEIVLERGVRVRENSACHC